MICRIRSMLSLLWLICFCSSRCPIFNFICASNTQKTKSNVKIKKIQVHVWKCLILLSPFTAYSLYNIHSPYPNSKAFNYKHSKCITVQCLIQKILPPRFSWGCCLIDLTRNFLLSLARLFRNIWNDSRAQQNNQINNEIISSTITTMNFKDQSPLIEHWSA